MQVEGQGSRILGSSDRMRENYNGGREGKGSIRLVSS